MSLFDKLKDQTTGAGAQSADDTATNPTFAGVAFGGGGGRSVSVVFPTIPATLEEFCSLPQASMQTPFDTAALFIVALGLYKVDKNVSIAMINHLKGPQPMSNQDKSFLSDRMAQNGKVAFIAESYFSGATPQNDYTPTEPYTIVVSDDAYSYQEQGYAGLKVCSGGADSPRPIKMRQAKDGKWYLWEYSTILSDIRAPESTNPWA